MVLEEAPASASKSASAARETRLLPLSAKTPEALSALSARLRGPARGGAGLDDVCFQRGRARAALDHRAVFVARDRAGMAAALRGFVAGAPAAARGQASYGARPRLVFVVPGQGAQWLGMGRALLREEPVFRESLERSSRALSKYVDFDLLQQLHAAPDSAGYRLKDIDAIQPALFAFAVGYAELLRSLGVEPDGVIGHSVGEVAAAHIAGVLDLDRAAQIVCRRSALMRRTSGNGAMALVELTMDQARARLERFGGKVAVAGNNSPNASVISGDPQAVREVLAELERDKIFCRQIKVDVASHSPQMEPLAVELAGELSGMQPQGERVPLHSTVFGRRVQGSELGAEYWGKNLRQPVLFGTTVQTLLGDGEAVFVELGPHPALVPSIQQTAQASRREVTAVACGRREEPEQGLLLSALGAAWCAGYPLDFRRLFPSGGRAVALPLYPWQRERHWVALAEPVPPGAQGSASQQAARRRDLRVPAPVPLGGRAIFASRDQRDERVPELSRDRRRRELRRRTAARVGREGQRRSLRRARVEARRTPRGGRRDRRGALARRHRKTQRSSRLSRRERCRARAHGCGSPRAALRPCSVPRRASPSTREPPGERRA